MALNHEWISTKNGIVRIRIWGEWESGEKSLKFIRSLYKIALEENASAMFLENQTLNVMSREATMFFIKKLDEFSKLIAVANFRSIIPTIEETESIALMSNLSGKPNVPIKTYYSEREGMAWLQEKLGEHKEI